MQQLNNCRSRAELFRNKAYLLTNHCLYLSNSSSYFSDKLPILKKYKKIKDDWYKKQALAIYKKSMSSEVKVLIALANKDFSEDRYLEDLIKKAGRYLPGKARLHIERLDLLEEDKVGEMTTFEIFKIYLELTRIYLIIDRQIELLLNSRANFSADMALKQIHSKIESRVILPPVAHMSIDSCRPGVGMT